MDELSLRISDAEREQAVAVLREHLLAGRLTLEEFTERVGAAYGARTGQELVRVNDDLPETTPATAGVLRKPSRFTAAILAHVVRRGRLRLPRRCFAFSLFADVDLDLREAAIENPVTTVRVFAFFGNTDVYVPEGVDADVGGFTFVGHRRDWGRDAPSANAPAVRVRVLGLFGTVDVWRVPPKVQGTYVEIIDQVRAQTRLPPAAE
jgi:hypothetical protein